MVSYEVKNCSKKPLHREQLAQGQAAQDSVLPTYSSLLYWYGTWEHDTHN